MKNKPILSLKMKIHYLYIGILDAFRLWHIRAIFYLLLATVVCLVLAIILNAENQNNFLSNMLLNISAGLITGVILFWISTLKSSQRYSIEKRKNELLNLLTPVESSYEFLKPYIQICYPRKNDITNLEKCTYDDINKILSMCETSILVNFEDLFRLLKYNKNDIKNICYLKEFISELLPKTRELFNLSFKHDDAIGLQKAFHDLRKIIDAFSDLYKEYHQFINKCEQLNHLIDTKFI